MSNGTTVTVNIGELQQQVLAELRRALGEEAELMQRLEQTRTEIAGRRGQLDLLAHLAQQGQQQQQQQPETEALPPRTLRGRPRAETEALPEPMEALPKE